MKKRTDFVTNSSSTSYIIAYKDTPNIDEETLQRYPFMRNYKLLVENALFSEGDGETTRGVTAKTKEELNIVFLKRYTWRRQTTIEELLKEDDYLENNYNEALNAINQGYIVLFKDVDYYDTYCSNMIKALAKDSEDFLIIKED